MIGTKRNKYERSTKNRVYCICVYAAATENDDVVLYIVASFFRRFAYLM